MGMVQSSADTNSSCAYHLYEDLIRNLQSIRMAFQKPQDEYLQAIRGRVPAEHGIHAVLRSSYGSSQRVYYTDLDDIRSSDIEQLTRQAGEDAMHFRHRVCVIENISTEWIGALGVAWDIDKDFWIAHASNPAGDSLWDAVTSSEARQRANQAFFPKLTTFPGKQHLDGVVPHVEAKTSHGRFSRRFEPSNGFYGCQTNIRISYCRASEHLYLFLVDPPLIMQPSEQFLIPARLSAWVPYAENRGGLPIPQLYERHHFSAFESLQSFFSHEWQLDFIFERSGAIEVEVFAHFWAASLWWTNLRFLDRDVKKIAFRDIRKPNVAINNLLHERRHDLDTLRSEASMAASWPPAAVRDFGDQEGTELTSKHDEALVHNAFGLKLNGRHTPASSSWLQPPAITLKQVLSGSSDIERFLMDTFQLLMSSISVLDAQTSLNQAARSTQLTILATIFLPLSLVTGIWGMNTKEINDSPVSSWAAAVTLGVVFLCMAILMWIIEKLKRSDESQKVWRRMKPRLGLGA